MTAFDQPSQKGPEFLVVRIAFISFQIPIGFIPQLWNMCFLKSESDRLDELFLCVPNPISERLQHCAKVDIAWLFGVLRLNS